MSDALTIRPLTDADLPALRTRIAEHQDYHRALEPHWPAGTDIAADYLAYLQAECAEYDGQILVAADGPVLAGFVCVTAHRKGAPDDPAPHAFVHDLFVAPECRRRGLATRLMNAAEAFAVSQGAAEMRLAVLDRNRDARAYYDQLGFRGYARVLRKRLGAGG